MATLIVDPETIETVDPQQYPFVMTAEEAIVASTSITELVAALPGMAEGYLDLDDEHALYARHELAVQAAREAQDELARSCEAFDPDNASEEVLTVMFGLPKTTSLAGLKRWDEPVPLVLIATDYAPFTDALAPAGNVKFINPADERSFLDTLMDVEMVDLVVAG